MHDISMDIFFRFLPIYSHIRKHKSCVNVSLKNGSTLYDAPFIARVCVLKCLKHWHIKSVLLPLPWSTGERIMLKRHFKVTKVRACRWMCGGLGGDERNDKNRFRLLNQLPSFLPQRLFSVIDIWLPSLSFLCEIRAGSIDFSSSPFSIIVSAKMIYGHLITSVVRVGA